MSISFEEREVPDEEGERWYTVRLDIGVTRKNERQTLVSCGKRGTKVLTKGRS